MLQQGTVLKVVSEPPEAGRGWPHIAPHSPQEKPSLRTPCSQTSGVRSCVMCSYCLSALLVTTTPGSEPVHYCIPAGEDRDSCGGLHAGSYISLSLKSYLMCLLKIATSFLKYWNCSHLEITLMLVVEMVFFFFFLSPKPFRSKSNNLYSQGQDSGEESEAPRA